MTPPALASMSSSIARRSPLGAIQSSDPTLNDDGLFERAFLTHVNLRLDAADTKALAAVHRMLGLHLPLTPNTTAAADALLAIWLGPDEWLLLAERQESGSLVAEMQAELTGHLASVVDISTGQTVIRLRGPSTRDVLARGCALDLDPAVFAPGACAQTLLARAQVLLLAVDSAPTVDVIVRRSFAPYVAAWLEDAGSQHGLRFVPKETS